MSCHSEISRPPTLTNCQWSDLQVKDVKIVHWLFILLIIFKLAFLVSNGLLGKKNALIFQNIKDVYAIKIEYY